MTSIRLRLLRNLLLFFLFTWAALVGSIYYQTSHEVEEIYDAHLRQSAGELMALAAHEHEERRKGESKPNELSKEVAELERHVGGGGEYTPHLAFRIWSDGHLLLRTRDAPNGGVPGFTGIETLNDGGEHWRRFSLHDDELSLVVQVAERYDIRGRIVTEVSLAAVYPVLFAFPVLALMIWFAVGRALRPLRRVACEVSERSPSQLEPMSLKGTPREVAPLVIALNRLLTRLEEAFERERRFTADASHELRTPLASLKTQAQVALRAADGEERDRALAQIVSGVDRATHVMEQLLTLARLDPEQRGLSGEPVELTAVAAETVALIAPQAIAKGVELGLEEDGGGCVVGRPPALSILLRNLVDNAVRYTPPGGQVEVAVREAQGEVELSVSDSGPGVPADERERVFERFHRGGANGESGCGLGLSIVRRIADLHAAQITLADAPGGGLLVRVRFPACDPQGLGGRGSNSR